ncbi:peroxisome assembly protein 26-like [Babylonia areolata]|uniref:peroxisome assembly protein 26-like n=1 Tax=Babylonia areolata TaxID=304850 RepID=UPI003FCF2396
MECEVRKGEGDGEGMEQLITVLEEEVKSATDLLLLTDFHTCLDTCHHVIASVQTCGDHDSHSVDRLDKVQEAATVIGIQALAEQGTWREVIPFVENVYTHMAACPAAIMQMCLLLHSHVREYMVCHSLMDAWLEWDDHRHTPESGAIVATYITNVLVPLRAYNLIPQVVERCTVLSSEEKQALLSPRVPSSPQMDPVPACHVSENNAATKESAASELHTCGGKDHENKSKCLKIVSVYLNLAKKLWRSLAKRGWCQQLRRASRIFFLISFVLLALLHVQTDVTANFSRAMELWKTAAGALYTWWSRQPPKVL